MPSSSCAKAGTGYAVLNVLSHTADIIKSTDEYVMLPVWLLYTRYHGKDYLFAMNGQTGKMVGDLPLSWLRGSRSDCLNYSSHYPAGYDRRAAVMLKRIQGCCFTLLVLLLFCCPLAVSAAGTVEAAAWAKVEDDAQLLDGQQLEQLQTQAQQLADQTGFIVFIKTTTSTGGLEVRRYLADQYELAGGSDSQKAILLGIDMAAERSRWQRRKHQRIIFRSKRPMRWWTASLTLWGTAITSGRWKFFLHRQKTPSSTTGFKPGG